MKHRVAIACGGTGGHLFPGLAVAEVLEKKDWEILLLISSKQIDEAALKYHSHFQVRVLSTIGWPGFKGIAWIKFFWRYWLSVKQCQTWFKNWRPDVVIGMGGFTSAVPLRCASCWKIPTLIHESNAIPGRVTVWLSKKVDRVLVGFSACQKALGNQVKSIVTGTPLKVKPVKKERNLIYPRFEFDPKRKTLLIMGGSQGAKALNEIVVMALRYLESQKESWQFIHLTGHGEKELVEMNYRREGFKAKVMEFCSDMGDIYQITDFAISRSGAASLSELAAWEIPSFLIPFPFAAGNHQVLNARIFEEAGAGLMVEQSALTPEKLANSLKRVVVDEVALTRMKEGCRKLAVLNGDERVALQIEALIKNKRV